MYTLNKLSYSYDSLEPYIDTHTCGLHYDKYAKRYLNTLNGLLDSLHYDYRYPIEDVSLHINEFPENIQQNILFNLGGVINHEIFFNSLNPRREKPTGPFLEKINMVFGNYENFKKKFREAALQVKGSGYTFLVTDQNDNLRIINLSNQDCPYSYQLIPLMVLDMWEHAYYLNYKCNKDAYINDFFDAVDFSVANNYYQNKTH